MSSIRPGGRNRRITRPAATVEHLYYPRRADFCTGQPWRENSRQSDALRLIWPENTLLTQEQARMWSCGDVDSYGEIAPGRDAQPVSPPEPAAHRTSQTGH